MNVAPVAKQGEDQQDERDQQQAGSLRRVDGVAAMFGVVVVLGSAVGHADIVALGATGAACIGRNFISADTRGSTRILKQVREIR